MGIKEKSNSNFTKMMIDLPTKLLAGLRKEADPKSASFTQPESVRSILPVKNKQEF